MEDRFIRIRAAGYHLALPVVGIQSILRLSAETPDVSVVENQPNSVVLQPRQSISLARLLGAAHVPNHEPSRFTLVGQRDSTELRCCAIDGNVTEGQLEPLPKSVETTWPGLIRGLLLLDKRWILVLEPAILLGVMEGWLASKGEN